MNCQGCGTENLLEARFCVNCGAPLLVRCPQCDAVLPPGARFCPACGKPLKSAITPLADPANSVGSFTAAGRRLVTILFADFEGFTAYVNDVDAEDVHFRMRALWDSLDSLIKSHGGTVEKHMGDAIMAVFGDKVAHEDDPAEAVRAALEMQACLQESRGTGPVLPLQMRIGVHTGILVLEPMASGEFRTTGEAVNLASRLQQHAPAGGILISHNTYRSIYGLFDMQAMPPLTVKGKSDPVQTYKVIRAKPRALARVIRGVEDTPTEMIGRKLELEHLQSAFKTALEEDELQLITILGEAGIGKTRLLQEFQHWSDLLPQRFWFFRGQASASTSASPYPLVREIFAARFEIQDSDRPAVAREKLESGIVALLNKSADSVAWAEQDKRLMAHFIGHLVGLDFSSSPYLHDLLSDPQQIRQRAFHYLRQFFSALSRGTAPGVENPQVRGVLLVAEDIHLSDDGSLDVVSHLAATCQGFPIMILCAARPTLLERRPAWGEGHPAQARLPLEALTRRESRSLVESTLCKAGEIPQALEELIVGGAEGNPFFIEEIIKMLIDQKVIVPGPDRWRIEPERLAAARVPATLTGVLQVRLDSLSAAERAALQRAAVVGRVFWDRALEELCSVDKFSPGSSGSVGSLTRTAIPEALAGLRQKELIFRREASSFAGATEYVFKHELLRNVTYEGVLKKFRREHHAHAAEWLIQQSGERVGEFASLVAGHFEQARRFSEAADWYGRAGQQARAGYDPSMAVEYFRKALSLLGGANTSSSNAQPGTIPPSTSEQEPRDVLAKRVEWLEGLADGLGHQANFVQAIEVAEQMRSLAERLSDDLAQARAWNHLAYLQERRGDNRASVLAAEQAERFAANRDPNGRREQIRALYLKGWALYRLADWEPVLALATRTAALCEECGDRPGLANSCKLHGVVHLQYGHYSEADRYFEQGLALSLETGDRRNAGAMWSNLGESARLRGDFATAVGFYQKALAIARQIGHRESETIYLSNLSGARVGLGEFEQAEAGLREAIKLSTGSKSGFLSEALSFLAEACLGQGKVDDARDAAQRGLGLARESENELDYAFAWRVLGRVNTRVSSISSSETPSPDACFAESLRLFKKINADAEQARTLRAWAEYETLRGHAASAEKMNAEARSIFERLSMSAEIARTPVVGF